MFSNALDNFILFIFWDKYILAPQTITLSPDGPPNYHFLIFWPHPSIYVVNSKQKSKNTPPTLWNSHG
jgi:hypothetical protein